MPPTTVSPPLTPSPTASEPLSTTATNALHALTPCLSVPRPSREARRTSQALDRLQAALTLAAASNVSLLDSGAIADVSHALRDVLEVSARAAAAYKQRPRIRTTADAARVKDASTQPVPRANLSATERRRLDVAANRIDTVIQVALWKQRDQLKAGPSEVRRNARVPLEDDVRARHRGRLGRKGRLFSTGDMKGRKLQPFPAHQQHPDAVERFKPLPPNQDLLVVVQERGKPVYTSDYRPTERTHSEGAAASTPIRQESALRALTSLRGVTNNLIPIDPTFTIVEKQQQNLRPWEFSLVESPITPLRSRTLDCVDDGKIVMAMWRGVRVSVKVIRRERDKFYREGDYLYALGHSPNIPSLLGGHWENAQKSKKSTKKSPSTTSAAAHHGSGHLDAANGNVGYLILEVANGVSLDKLVRDGKLADTVSQIRVLDRVVAALVYAQQNDPAITHQDIHPGNILLVPSTTVTTVVENGKPVTNGEAIDMESGVIDLESTSSSSPLNGVSLVGMPPTISNSTVGISDKSTAGDSSTVVDVLEPHPYTASDETLPGIPDGDVIIDEFGSPQKKGAAPTFVSNAPNLAPTGLAHKFPPQKLPQIPKVEEVAEALTVLERVALHNEIDASVGADVGQHLRKSDARNPRAPSTKSAAAPKRAKLTRAATAIPSHDKMSAGTRNTLPRSNEATVSTVSSFTVKVMDFAAAGEAGGLRKVTSWNSNEAIAGYCPPEKVTANMWRKMHHARDKERERERERERRAIVARGASNGRHSPRPPSQRLSSNGIGGNMGVLGSRSGSSGNHRRKAFDSETYALFGDDHLDTFTDTEDNHQYDSSGQVPMSLLTDRSGRRVAARGPDHLREELRTRPMGENGRTYGRQSSSDGLFKGKDGMPDDGALIKYWNKSNGDAKGEQASALNRMSKIDVWSVGGLLYYMVTRKHPPPDSWATQRSFVDGKEMRQVAPEMKELIEMCVQRDVNKRACMRDVKRQIDSFLQGLMFGKGVALLETDREAAFLLLDKAVGIKSSRVVSEASGSGSSSMSADMTVAKAEARSLGDGSSVAMQTLGHHRVLGLNQKTRMALSCLPLVVVRRVEWEAAGRYLKRSNEELLSLRRALVSCRWTKGDVSDGAAAISYLSRRAEEGVSSAQSALGWIYRWGAGGVKKDVSTAMTLWEQAVRLNEPEAANGLGLIFHHGRDNITSNGKRAREYYELAVSQGYPAAAVNLGVMLHDGAAGLAVDGNEARRLYQVAVRHGDAIAANNLGLLLQHGASGVQRDACEAVKMYEIGIMRGERHHACRNLGELLWNGAEGVPRARANAVEYFRQAVERGDETSRREARIKVRKLLAAAEKGDEGAAVAKELAERCWRLVEEGAAR